METVTNIFVILGNIANIVLAVCAVGAYGLFKKNLRIRIADKYFDTKGVQYDKILFPDVCLQLQISNLGSKITQICFVKVKIKDEDQSDVVIHSQLPMSIPPQNSKLLELKLGEQHVLNQRFSDDDQVIISVEDALGHITNYYDTFKNIKIDSQPRYVPLGDKKSSEIPSGSVASDSASENNVASEGGVASTHDV